MAASKVSLPLTNETKDRPSVDAVRQKLGGRQQSAPGAGELVLAEMADETQQPAVVVFATDEQFDLWLGDGVVRRFARSLTTPLFDAPANELKVVASDVRLFTSLREGDRVRCGSKEGRLDEGKLLEKCRYGALILRDDGVIVGAGFQRVWPAVDAPAQH
jgi:hypothetical protein